MRLFRLAIVVSVVFISIFSVAEASSLNSDLPELLKSGRELLLTVKSKMSADKSIKREFKELKIFAEDLQVADLLLQERLRQNQRRQKSLEALLFNVIGRWN